MFPVSEYSYTEYAVLSTFEMIYILIAIPEFPGFCHSRNFGIFQEKIRKVWKM